MCFLNNVLFFSCAAILSLRGISAGGEASLSEAEKHADELNRNARLAVWELLENENARNVIHEYLAFSKIVHENPASANMMVGVTQQFKDTFVDEDGGAVSVKHIADGIRELATKPESTKTIEAIFKSFRRVIHNPQIPKLLEKFFDFFEACVRTHRGPELVMALADGICSIVERPNPKERILQAFKNGKAVISTSFGQKVKNFIVHG